MITLRSAQAALTNRRPVLASRWRVDHEFLAPALEILETPPSPVRMAFISLICAFLTVTLVWAYFGWIDVVASAQGKIQPVGRVKIVQPLEIGKVSRILAVDGQHVSRGDALIEFEAGELTAEAMAAKIAYNASRAEVARRSALEAAVDGAGPLPPISWPADLPNLLRAREEKVAVSSLAQLRGSLAVIAAQRSQKAAERDQIAETIANQQQLVATLKQRVDMRTSLMRSGATALAAVIDATETFKYQLTQLAMQKGQLVSADTGIAVFDTQAEKARRDFRSENAEKLREALREAANTEQTLAKAQAKLRHASLLAPESGVVQASVATSVGQVLTPGEEVLRIVSDTAPLEVQVYVLNRDIGFVEIGQDVTVKVEAFPFSRYGVIAAHVAAIAGDAIPEADAGKLEGRPNEPSAQIGYGGAQRTQNLVFPVRLRLEANSIYVGDRKVPLASGMTVTADFQTGRRRLIDYFLSPLSEIGSRAMHER